MTASDLQQTEDRLQAMDVGVHDQLAELRAEVRRELDRVRAEFDAVRAHLDRLSAERVDAVLAHTEAHTREVVDLAVERVQARVARLERAVREVTPPSTAAPGAAPAAAASASSAPEVSPPPPPVSPSSEAVAQPPSYAAFEEEMRGPSSLVRELQEAYVADVEASPRPELPVVDIGCGRGEFVALLTERGIPAYGVDLNETFAADAAERGLDVRLERGDLHLAGVDEGSLRGVVAFHVVEHLPMASILELLELSHRALAAGGVLVLETPNPENLAVGAHRFWLDPTHLRPLPPLLLAFLVREAGFEDVEVRRLHPLPPAVDPALARDRASRALIEVVNEALTGPIDYAVVARRS